MALIRDARSHIRFPFPLGKGLGVRLSEATITPETISDGTKLRVVAQPSQSRYRWVVSQFEKDKEVVRMTRKRPSLAAVLLVCAVAVIGAVVLKSLFALTSEQSLAVMAVPYALIELWRFGFFRSYRSPRN